MPTITDADREAAEAVIRESKPGKAYVPLIKAFARHREQEVAKIVAMLDDQKQQALDAGSNAGAFWIVQMKKSIEAGEYRNDA